MDGKSLLKRRKRRNKVGLVVWLFGNYGRFGLLNNMKYLHLVFLAIALSIPTIGILIMVNST
jgi:hypothetical protein